MKISKIKKIEWKILIGGIDLGAGGQSTLWFPNESQTANSFPF